MVQSYPPQARLRRSIPGRLFAGSTFQFILTLAVLLEVFMIGVVISLGGVADLLPSLPAAAVFWVIWGMGLTAGAHADGDGVRWRYFRSHTYSWNEIDQIRFGGRLVKGTAAINHAAILVSVAGREHPITPGFGCGRPRLVEFGNDLIALAAARGVPARVDPTDDRWDGLRQL